ncbi:hypothetical protein LTR91_006665 [Friedmanniomyces endolithicus]|uniref:Uncharacterized protein n=1 Tax=Friedmanniomyces endolithicus TaxID=329885 RepID=A0AAN6KRE4_9PEZI|nr:hypothetical protein LTR38_012944 [Friedmanniomyces endolithicus]KAK0789153.1 hypothetical protein LTR75_012414 [Friedmanniomyces endolithicus]KAK0799029.1 hypothetical protein LTR59_006275 [Friedmanniomyces endolithicus]KAK0836843.1 hypothetical protein LTR03_013311 [Friedmanniomyces endolithicus]KAK0853309.1 hypothetical protein LTS02_011998 [Friedmanniomyces endolithicus]
MLGFGRLKKYVQRLQQRNANRDKPTSITIEVSSFGNPIDLSQVYMFPGRWYDVEIRRGNALDKSCGKQYRMPDVMVRRIPHYFRGASTQQLELITFDARGKERSRAIGDAQLDGRRSVITQGTTEKNPLLLAIVPL